MIRLFVAIALAGCGGGSARPAQEARAVEAAAVAVPSLEPIRARLDVPVAVGSVVATQPTCQEGASEVCNGLDDDCDDTADEGCDLRTGGLQVTLSWVGDADLDLYVSDPAGYALSYQNRESPSGGVFDREGRGACNQTQANDTVENVSWEHARPPTGRYEIEVRHWGACGSPGAAQGTVVISVGGDLAGVYNVALEPRERRTVGAIVIE